MASQSKMRPDLAHHPGDRCLFRTVVSGPPDGYLLSHPRAAAAYLAGISPSRPPRGVAKEVASAHANAAGGALAAP